jgi:hypothetical protein
MLIDKTPHNAKYWEFVTRLYPRAPYIAMTRNPLAVRWSLKRWLLFELKKPARRDASAPFEQPFDDAADEATKLMRFYLSSMAALLENGQLNLLHVRYEDLASNAHEVVSRVCDFLGVTYTERLLDYGVHPVQMPGNLGDPLTAFRYSKPEPALAHAWERELVEDPDQRQLAYSLLESMPDRELAVCGYTKRGICQELDMLPSSQWEIS